MLAYWLLWLIKLSSVLTEDFASASWSYADQESWPGECLSGNSQSPINIEYRKVDRTCHYPSIRFNNFNYNLTVTNAIIQNGGSAKFGNLSNLSGGGLLGTYIFDSAHYHYPSEHLLNSKSYDAEVHLVFYSSKYPDIETASEVKDGLAVVALFYVVENAIPKQIHGHRTNNQHEKDNLIPIGTKGFYSYSGSLTTPPCNEVVKWIVLDGIGKISPKTIFPFYMVKRKRYWTYDKQDEWPGYCNKGCHQSPINIETKDVINCNKIIPLKFENVCENLNATVKNTGNTISVSIPDEAKVSLSGGGLNTSYVFQNLHFHWPSEHTIDKQYYDLEAHMVFYSSGYSNINEALKYKGGVVVVGMFYNKNNDEGSKALDCLSKVVKLVSESVDAETTSTLVLDDLIPNKESEFYSYNGSLTTPDCNEVVRWFVMKEVGGILPKQYNDLTTIYDANNKLLSSNNRKIQPLNGRLVSYKSASA